MVFRALLAIVLGAYVGGAVADLGWKLIGLAKPVSFELVVGAVRDAAVILLWTIPGTVAVANLLVLVKRTPHYGLRHVLPVGAAGAIVGAAMLVLPSLWIVGAWFGATTAMTWFALHIALVGRANHLAFERSAGGAAVIREDLR